MDVLSIRGDVLRLLDDVSGAFWLPEDIDSWIFDGELQIATLRPDSTAVTEPVALIAGTRQMIPLNGLRFIDMPRNILANNMPGMAVTDIARDNLDRYLPNWHMEEAASAVQHFVFDVRTPREFYVYPPVVAGTKVDLCYSLAPAEYSAVNQNTKTTLQGNYRPALIEWALHRARTIDIKANRGIDRSAHLNSFYQMLGFKGETDQAVAPKPSARS